MHVEASVALSFTECLKPYPSSKPYANEDLWNLYFKVTSEGNYGT